MKLKKYLSGLYYKLKKDSNKLQNDTLCGVDLRVLPDTIRKSPDQDDRWFFELAKRHEIIYDLGANVGYTALLALIQNPKRPYILIDPNPKALNRAFTNLISNNLGFKAHYYCVFVSNTNDEHLNFYTIGSGQAGSMYPEHAKSASAINSFMEVKTVTLDQLFEYYNLKPDLIKIDVEGAETKVMEGACSVAQATQCTFFIEMHSTKDLGMEQAGQFILNWCSKMHYKAWYLKTGEELKLAETIKHRGKCHLLLMPEALAYPNYLTHIGQNAPLPNSI